MRTVLAVIGVALALPAAAQAKGPIPAELCGPDACRAVTAALHFTGSAPAPAPGPYYELRVEFGSGFYYESRSRLVAHAEDFGAVTWVPLALDVPSGLRPYPAPRVTRAWVGERSVSGDPSGYLRLVTLTGPFVVPHQLTEFAWIRLESQRPDPWTSQALVYYPRDRVLLTHGSTYVQVPERIASALESARPLDGAGRTRVPWLPLGVAGAGGLGLLALWRGRARAARALPAVPATS